MNNSHGHFRQCMGLLCNGQMSISFRTEQ